MSRPTTINVIDQGMTVQGTGHLLGTPQYFVRLAGCSVKCPIRAVCDERAALKAENGTLLDVEAVADAALGEARPGGWLHITGGEPADQYEAVEALILAGHARGLKAHIQTSGVADFEMRFDWMTVSPKLPPDELRMRYGNEMVLVYDGQADAELIAYMRETSFWHYYLVPLWVDGMSNAREAAAACRRLTRRDAHLSHFSAQEWLLTIQAHKFWGVK